MPAWKLAPLTTPPASTVGTESGMESAGARPAARLEL